MIPKKIHYCWFGGNPLNDVALKCIASWKKHCPGYEIIEWNEKNFDVNYNDYMRQAYESKKWAFVSDVARLKIIHEFGGFYFDTDVEIIRPIDDLRVHEAFFGIEMALHREVPHIATGLGFGAQKNNKVVEALLHSYDNTSFLRPDGTMDLTPCPFLNLKTMKEFGFEQRNINQTIDGAVVYASEYFDPQHLLYASILRVLKKWGK